MSQWKRKGAHKHRLMHPQGIIYMCLCVLKQEPALSACNQIIAFHHLLIISFCLSFTLHAFQVS